MHILVGQHIDENGVVIVYTSPLFRKRIVLYIY